MPAANTKDCFTEFIDMKVVGVLFDALPPGRRDIAAGTKTLIFEDGRGLTVTSSGAYWIDSAEDVARAVRIRRTELGITQREIEGVLQVAGAIALEDSQP